MEAKQQVKEATRLEPETFKNGVLVMQGLH